MIEPFPQCKHSWNDEIKYLKPEQKSLNLNLNQGLGLGLSLGLEGKENWLCGNKNGVDGNEKKEKIKEDLVAGLDSDRNGKEGREAKEARKIGFGNCLRDKIEGRRLVEKKELPRGKDEDFKKFMVKNPKRESISERFNTPRPAKSTIEKKFTTPNPSSKDPKPEISKYTLNETQKEIEKIEKKKAEQSCINAATNLSNLEEFINIYLELALDRLTLTQELLETKIKKIPNLDPILQSFYQGISASTNLQ